MRRTMPKNRTLTLFALVSVMTVFGACRNARTQPTPGEVELEPAFPALRFTRPLALESPRDGTNRLFVVEQSGRILVFPNDSAATKTKKFLDIRSLVNSEGNEEGLLGLAFHPSYRENGFLYVNYTASHPRRTVIARYQVSAADPDAADHESGRILLEFDQPFSNHNGGQLAFGPDGFLYVATGDGGSGGDPYGNGQSLSTLLGKILRIDVDAPRGGKNYGIPPDNPFAGTAFRGEIWAYGLRNPWRFSFDPDDGKLWAGDVGQDRIEEVDIIEKGRNYGWNRMEGSTCFQPARNCDTTGLVLPVWEYTHQEGVCVTGGFVYHGSRRPDLRRTYICADYANGKIWSLRLETPGKAKATRLTESRLPIASFGVDTAGELYVCSFDGLIYRFKR
jgi:glucose/arabinose dehydrogenase